MTMNATTAQRTPMNTITTDDTMITNATFEPLFDENGNIVALTSLKVRTDKRRAVQAMEELAQTHQAGDEIVLASGWTQKQKRILNMKAPNVAHQIHHTQRWNAKKGEVQNSVTVILPFEASWALFEQLFDHSIEIAKIETHSEDVMPGRPGEELSHGGRLFYAKAVVRVNVHLANGQTRPFEGMGVAYDTLPEPLTSNMTALNAARRTAEKGAISDAKREALSHLGRVFRRAYEDGAEIMEQIETLLMERLKANNPIKTPKTAQAPKARANVISVVKPAESKTEEPTPKAAKTQTDEAQKGETTKDAVTQARQTVQDIMDLCDNETTENVHGILEENKDDLQEALALLNITWDDFVADRLANTQNEKEQTETNGPTLVVTRKTGENILKAYKDAFGEQTTAEGLKSVLDANTELARELTKKQKAELLKLFQTHNDRVTKD